MHNQTLTVDIGGRKINNWKIVQKIALGLGAVFAVFTVIAAILNYQLDNLIYNTSQVPKNFIPLSIVNAIIPYLISAILSFLVAFIVSSATKSADKKETEKISETQTTLEEAES